MLDVRRDDERAAGHVAGSTHIPLHALAQLPRRCARGTAVGTARFRAGIAAGLLDRAGHDVVLIDDDYAAAVGSGLAAG